MYRELLQNANDANAKIAEVRFLTGSNNSPTPNVDQVVFRNDGLPFGASDWSRLRNIAEGNPDVSKIGAFGVGFYSVFSVCDEPLVVSGDTALTFVWRGDSLWARSGPVEHPDKVWTSFVLPSRDPYPIPDLLEFAQFLCTSLTFTTSLHTIQLFIDDKNVLTISKTMCGSTRPITAPRSSFWWSNDGMVTRSPNSLFSIGRGGDTIVESFADLRVVLHEDTYSIRTRYVSARVDVHVPPDLQRKLERTTKKKTPRQISIHIFIDAAARSYPSNNKAAEVLQAFSPHVGLGSVFIGFRTSQTTGLAVHLAAPLIPTVEREAIDLQDPALKRFNSDLLSISGAVMRLCFEEGMASVALRWKISEPDRETAKNVIKEDNNKEGNDIFGTSKDASDIKQPQRVDGDHLSAFMRFMSTSVRKITEAVKFPLAASDDDDNLLNPLDTLPFRDEERDAIMLMQAFSPELSTPERSVGILIAKGFLSCMAKKPPSVLTTTGVTCGADGLLPFRGIESFITKNVVRKNIFLRAEPFLKHVAGCRFLNLSDLIIELQSRPLPEKELVRFVRWWVKFCHADANISSSIRQSLYDAVSLKQTGEPMLTSDHVVRLNCLKYFCERDLDSSVLPMPSSVIPLTMQNDIGLRLLRGDVLLEWFKPLPFMTWANFVAGHKCLTEGQKEHSKERLEVLARLSKHHSDATWTDRVPFERWLAETLGDTRCVPVDDFGTSKFTTEFPSDVYLPDAEIGIFQGLGQFRKVAEGVGSAGISKNFLVALGVRKAISIDFLFTQLHNLKWNNDPQPLVRYLRSVTLTDKDLEKLRTCQYLPEAKDKSRTYSPSELLLPSEDLSIFPFVKVLQWPSTSPLHLKSPDAAFLMKLGCKLDPPLGSVLRFIGEIEDKHSATMMKCFDYLFPRMAPGGAYLQAYGPLRHVKFLPATHLAPLSDKEQRIVLESPATCYSMPDAACMGFPVLCKELYAKYGRMFGNRFSCPENPTTEQLIMRLQEISSDAIQLTSSTSSPTHDEVCRVVAAFQRVFQYLSTQLVNLKTVQIKKIQCMKFIPCRNGAHLAWYRPGDVYFKGNEDNICSLLYEVVDFDPFLASVGVQSGPSASDLLKLTIRAPEAVFHKLGSHENYVMLLRRLASSLSTFPISPEVKRSPFLLGYVFSAGEIMNEEGSVLGAEVKNERPKYRLARAEEICVIDNSLFARKFSVLAAPQESDLERFYETIGSIPISKRVLQSFNVHGKVKNNTPLTKEMMSRIKERGPLLTSLKITSRELQMNAEASLSPKNLTIYEVDAITNELSLDRVVKRQDVSCCAKLRRNINYDMYITSNLDYFDVGNALGSIIFKKCHLEDAFLIASLLEASLDQLRERGFPVDRITKISTTETTPHKNASGGLLDEERITRLNLESTKSIEGKDRSIETPQEHVLRGGVESSGDVSAKESEPKSDGKTQGFKKILGEMFPDCTPSHIQSVLGPNPDLDQLRYAADILANDNCPKERSRPPEVEEGHTRLEQSQRSSVRNGNGRNRNNDKRKLGSGLVGLNNFVKEAFRPHVRGSGPVAGRFGNALQRNGDFSGTREESGTPARGFKNTLRSVDPRRKISPSEDLAQQHRVEAFVREATNFARTVPASGVHGSEKQVSSLPADLEQSAPSCDEEKVHNLVRFDGPLLNGLTSNGTKVFSQRGDRASEAFLMDNWDAVECFSFVLHNLCSVFRLHTKCVAVMHEDSGGTIAFNASGALFFNVRYFRVLHYRGGAASIDSACYTYWFTTMAHELAHNIQRGHDRTHGFITETFVNMHMLELAAALPNFLATNTEGSHISH